MFYLIQIGTIYRWIRDATFGYDASGNSGDPEYQSNNTLSQEELDIIFHVQTKARTAIKSQGSVDELKEILKVCPWITQVINLRDVTGYNLLQVKTSLSLMVWPLM